MFIELHIKAHYTNKADKQPILVNMLLVQDVRSERTVHDEDDGSILSYPKEILHVYETIDEIKTLIQMAEKRRNQ